jgi:hypothetical protein
MATVALQRIEGLKGEPQRRINGAVTGKGYTQDQLGRAIVDVLDAPQLIAKGWLYANLADIPSNPLAGVATVDFGAFPGSPMAQLTVLAGDIFDPSAVLQASVTPIATADHTADEHTADPPLVSAVVSGSNIIITAMPSGRDLQVPPGTPFGNKSGSQQPIAQTQLMPVGKWSVAWAFAE